MFGLFKKKTEEQVLDAQYQKLLKEAFDLSKSNRTASDAKYAAADIVLKKIENLQKK